LNFELGIILGFACDFELFNFELMGKDAVSLNIIPPIQY